MYEGEDEYSDELYDEMCEDSDDKIYYEDEKFNDMVNKKVAKDINFEWWNSKKVSKISKDINLKYKDSNDKMKSNDSHVKSSENILNNNNKILNRYDLPKDISYYVEEYQKRKEQAKNYHNQVENPNYTEDKNINDDKENYPGDNINLNNNIRSNTTTVYANSTLSNEKNMNLLNSNISEDVSSINKENNLLNTNINKSNENITIQNCDDNNKLVDNNIYIDRSF